MSFLQNLGKGFVRSAVNQVGRDGGKVISNKVYGDGHSTPIRGAGNSGSQEYNYIEGKEISIDEFQSHNLIGFFSRGTGHYILIGTLTLLFFGLSWIYYIIKFFKLQKLQTVPKLVQKEVHVYKPDRRYKYGERYEGTRINNEIIKVPASHAQISMYKKKSWYYLGIGITIILIQALIVVFNLPDEAAG